MGYPGPFCGKDLLHLSFATQLPWPHKGITTMNCIGPNHHACIFQKSSASPLCGVDFVHLLLPAQLPLPHTGILTTTTPEPGQDRLGSFNCPCCYRDRGAQALCKTAEQDEEKIATHRCGSPQQGVFALIECTPYPFGPLYP